MVIRVTIDLKLLEQEQKKFNWKRPLCPNCYSHVWGHGYIRCYFTVLKGHVFLKRYRCPHCGTVITMRPIGFWNRFQTAIEIIYKALAHRLSFGHWDVTIPRQRAGHWMRQFGGYCKSEGLRDMLQALADAFQRQVKFLMD